MDIYSLRYFLQSAYEYLTWGWLLSDGSVLFSICVGCYFLYQCALGLFHSLIHLSIHLLIYPSIHYYFRHCSKQCHFPFGDQTKESCLHWKHHGSALINIPSTHLVALVMVVLSVIIQWPWNELHFFIYPCLWWLYFHYII